MELMELGRKISRSEVETIGDGLYELDVPHTVERNLNITTAAFETGEFSTIARVDSGKTYLPVGFMEAYIRPDGARVVIGKMMIGEPHSVEYLN